MSEQPETRSFSCPHCATGIQIPYNLPPTSAPCPKCGENITSPALKEEEVQVPAPEPVVISAASEPEPIAPLPVSEPVSEPNPEPVSESVSSPPASPEESGVNRGGEQSTGSKGRLITMAAGGIALLLLGIVAWKVLTSFRGEDEKSSSADVSPRLTTEERRDKSYRSEGWVPEAEAILTEFFQAKTISQRAALTIRGKQNEAEMERIYREFTGEEYRTPASVYSPVSLSDEDTERGIFLMTYDRPEQFALRSFFRPIPPLRVKYGLEEPNVFLQSEAALENFLDSPLKVMAFFRRSPEGLKLDWKTYSQTKFRLLKDFVENPKRGQQGVFRVSIREDIDLSERDQAGFSVFRLSDPANREDYAKILVKDSSALGQALAHLRWRDQVVPRPPIKNATVSLVWSREPETKLQMDELICWEFLGLGGERGNVQAEEQSAP